MLGVLGSVFADGSLLSNAPLLALLGLSTAVTGAVVMGILGSKRPARFPPGPNPVPFVGNISGKACPATGYRYCSASAAGRFQRLARFGLPRGTGSQHRTVCVNVVSATLHVLC